MTDKMRAAVLKIRHTWGDIKPVTRIAKNKKTYNRHEKYRENLTKKNY